ncbi:MAG: hypothetical protein M0023_04000 [Desulfobacteraceae bacterium]|nr:hypothetical protein [Desulfobacteraceae bacterium]
MEDKQGNNKVWRLAADSTAGRLSSRKVSSDLPNIAEDASPQVARDNIVKDMMRIFDGLLGCSTKRSGVSLAFLHAHKSKPVSGTQKKLEQEIYRIIKGLVEQNSPNTGFALGVLYNNATYYYNKANVPLSFGIFLTSLVEFLEGHDCLSICSDEMLKLKTLLSRG